MAVLESRVEALEDNDGAGLLLVAGIAAAAVASGIWWYKNQREPTPALAELDLLQRFPLVDDDEEIVKKLAHELPKPEEEIITLAKLPMRQKKRRQGGVTVL